MRKIDKFELYEDNSGGLSIILFAGEDVAYVDCSLEYCPGSAQDIIKAFYRGLAVEDVLSWDSDVSTVLMPRVAQEVISGGELVWDYDTVWPRCMGANARREFNTTMFEYDEGWRKMEMCGEELYDYWIDEIGVGDKYFDEWYCDNLTNGKLKICFT